MNIIMHILCLINTKLFWFLIHTANIGDILIVQKIYQETLAKTLAQYTLN